MKKVILRIYAWFAINYQQYPYNEQWDKIFSDLLDNHDFTEITMYNAKLGGVSVWVANTPYACMNPHNVLNEMKIRPSRVNILRAIKKLNKQLKEMESEKISEFIKSSYP